MTLDAWIALMSSLSAAWTADDSHLYPFMGPAAITSLSVYVICSRAHFVRKGDIFSSRRLRR